MQDVPFQEILPPEVFLPVVVLALMVAFAALALANRFAGDRQAQDPAYRRFFGAILVADGHPTIRRTLTRVLRHRCGDLIVVDTGQKAVEAIESRGFDLVITDHMLDHVSGYEVSRRAKARRHDAPVILTCGSYELIDDAKLEASGADAVLRKPFHTDELLGLATRRRMV